MAIRGCASRQDIQAKWQYFHEEQKGNPFEELVKAYLQLEPEYASKLKLLATNQGIDIIAEQTYAEKGWSGMGDWLGTGRTRVSKSPNRKS